MFGWGRRSAPKWYRTWRHEAMHTLIEQNRGLDLNRWPRWDHDLAKHELTFSDGGEVRVRADVQVVGTTGRKDWLWSWANPNWTDAMTTDARDVRLFGEEHGISELITPSLKASDLNALGWELTAVAAKVTGSIGAYRPSGDAGGLFLLIRSLDEVKPA